MPRTRQLLQVTIAALLGACSSSPGAPGPRGDGPAASELGPGRDGGAGLVDAIEGPKTTDAGVAGDKGTLDGPSINPRLKVCQNLKPDPAGSATANHKAITSCLADVKLAVLAAGDYPISGPINMPASAVLRGADPASRPTLIVQPGRGANTVVSFNTSSPATSKAALEDVKIDVHANLGLYQNAAIVHFAADNARVKNCDLFNAQVTPTGKSLAAVYFISDTSTGGEVRNTRMYNNFYGVIFRGKSAAASNLVADSEIYNNKCDPITFAGYGVAEGNKIHDNGWDCENGPIPGGGIYTLTNAAGGVVRKNIIYNTCGHGMDFDRAANMIIEDNEVKSPGYQFGGAAPWCKGSAGALFNGLRESTIARNVIVNDGGPGNAAKFSGYDVFSAAGAAMYSDLPQGGNTIVGVIISEPRSPAGWEGSHNTFTDNQFRAACPSGSGCVGLGYFVSRGTGYLGTTWSASTTSYFTGNKSFGSNIGSVRCGGNWYAGGSQCPAGAPAPCNDDDYQHTGNQFHNDNCPYF